MSATIGKLFVAALVADGKVSTLLEFGKPQVMFTPTELPVFEFVAAFAKQYGKIPDTATIEAHTDEEIPTAAEPAEYYHDLLQMRWIERELKKSMKVAADLLGATGKDALQALETLRGCVTGLVAHQQQHQLVDFRDAYDLIVPDYVSKYTAEADGGVMLGWPTVDEMTGGLVRGDLASFIGRIALGKALAHGTPVLLADGNFKLIENMAEGDAVASIDGERSEIYGVYHQGERKVLRVTFGDGRHLDVDGEHLWHVGCGYWDAPRVMTTNDIRRFRAKAKRFANTLYIPLASGVSGGTQPTIDPYMLGVLLGDGCLTKHVGISSSDPEVLARVTAALPRMYFLADDHTKSAARAVRIVQASPDGRNPKNDIIAALKLLGVWGKKAEKKFLPCAAYAWGREDRMALLQGLMDTDGSVVEEGTVTFSSSSLQLARDVQKLVRSLGGKARLSPPKKTAGLDHYRVTVILRDRSEAFHLARKKQRCRTHTRHNPAHLRIVAVEPIGVRQCTCIAVTHPSRLFIAGDYIVTHNTWQMLKGCHHGWKHQGACQLFISMEMKTLPISQRLAAMEAHVPAIQVKNAALTTIGLGKLKGSLLEIKNAKSALWVVDGNFTATVDDVYALARQLKPDSIWIDGGYLLKHPTERDRFRRVAENADMIKQMLADLAPTVCSWQFARSGSKKAKKKGETADLDDIGYCVRGDQIITTDRGLVRIADLYKGHPTPVTVFDGGRMQSGKAVFRGMKPEVLVCFEDGTEVACSPEHRFWAHAGGDCFQWITAQDLKPGDAGLAHGNSTFAAPLVEAAAPSAGYLAMSSITLTPKLGELMGLLVGDGSTVNDNSWNLACAGSDPDLIQRVADSARDLWGYMVKKKPHNGCVYVQFHSKGIIEQLTALGQPRCTGPHKHAPAPVLASTADVRCAFLRGLFEADGTIGNNQLRLSTTSSRLAQDVQILLRSIGVVSYVTRKDKAVLQPGGYGAKWANFYVTIPKNAYAEFELKVGFASQRKRAILAAAKQCVYRPKRAYATRYDRGLTLLHVEKVVCTGREVEMFDIAEVAETSRFLVNGVVTHNTDAIGQVSSLVLGLYQPESIETTKSRDMKILKGRNGETGQFRTHWDFVGMNFDELVAENIEELSFV